MEPLVLFLEPGHSTTKPMTTRSSPVAKYHRVEVMLAERIRSGAYPDGALPAERALALEFGVARVTIRHALRRLEDQGLVVRQERRGTATATGERGAAPRLLREHVDQFLDRGRPDQRKVLRFGAVEASVAVAQALGIDAGERVLRVIRLRSRAGSPLTYTESFIPRQLAHVLDRGRLSRQPLIKALEEGGVKVGARSSPCAPSVALRISPRPWVCRSTSRCCASSAWSRTRPACLCSCCSAGTAPTASKSAWRSRAPRTAPGSGCMPVSPGSAAMQDRGRRAGAQKP